MEKLAEKANVINEVEPIIELLNELRGRLESLPRTTVAARQLSVIACKLEAWHEQYVPRVCEEPKPLLSEVPQREEIDKALKAYRRGGYFSLNERQKKVIEFFDKHYAKAA